MPYHLLPVYGGMMLGTDRGAFHTDDAVLQGLEVLKDNGITHIDTAQLYGAGKSESSLGRTGASSHFSIDTKWIAGWSSTPWATQDNILASARESLDRLQTDQVDVFYLHSPDNRVPYEDTLRGVDQVYRKGWFRRFGISNFSVDEIRRVVEVCEKGGFVRPSVYQGSYSAAARGVEGEVIPLLREHGIAFYAYSPISGGFLTKSRQFVTEGQGRFAQTESMGIYHGMYNKPAYMNFLDEWNSIAEDEGVSKAELAYRWVNHHSILKPEFGDAIVFGASRISQMEDTCAYLQAGPLSLEAARRIDGLWGIVKGDATIDHWQAARDLKK